MMKFMTGEMNKMTAKENSLKDKIKELEARSPQKQDTQADKNYITDIDKLKQKLAELES